MKTGAKFLSPTWLTARLGTYFGANAWIGQLITRSLIATGAWGATQSQVPWYIDRTVTQLNLMENLLISIKSQPLTHPQANLKIDQMVSRSVQARSFLFELQNSIEGSLPGKLALANIFGGLATIIITILNGTRLSQGINVAEQTAAGFLSDTTGLPFNVEIDWRNAGPKLAKRELDPVDLLLSTNLALVGALGQNFDVVNAGIGGLLTGLGQYGEVTTKIFGQEVPINQKTINKISPIVSNSVLNLFNF